jgi:hypothetical protein
MVNVAVVAELELFAADERVALPRPAGHIAVVESAGALVDLETGAIFSQVDNWVEFARVWVCEVVRRGRVPDDVGLAQAVARANGLGYKPELCAGIARAALQVVMKESAQVAG